MTEINVIDANGKIVFHSVEPRLMTEEQVHAHIVAWGGHKDNQRVLVTYTPKCYE